MKIALIAHDRKKDLMLKLVTAYKEILKDHNLYATGTTGQKIIETTGLSVHRFNPGPLGGDQQIGAMISEDNLDLIIFLRDPLAAQPHEPDVNALIRLSDVYEIPLATNIGTAEVLLRGLQAGFVNFREIIHENDNRPIAF
ncbi:methylglyoxal synthase [Melissococcus plutonius]|uniref:Methylglyoxal synthase n=1 Tax=Melissococcus plutonius (strain ATCC 35311 / DSM 29964 / CIP 104052 / LMG 20360 / NCIMB 702443) TaxID=940190 RepID=F3Y9K8_MELPT|nr:methylglyoxal synthase [Melissococcus plutonius]AIM24731.1 methylglyoxal synthase MgsA [Melissococcus plutonius S1]KMT24840.1 methylglyoxal synthase MgsA [Melissococcus plutonius]KMT26477.1 methylglyoxal synthase MgsA [Melissococcus plutonius]KMT27727.1 methylglyoxal synthase MgsA [Melissococcus plutonius]KMT29499.1 methylglyoxal synthase MgsA [Melissococcus plutonius]